MRAGVERRYRLNDMLHHAYGASIALLADLLQHRLSRIDGTWWHAAWTLSGISFAISSCISMGWIASMGRQKKN